MNNHFYEILKPFRSQNQRQDILKRLSDDGLPIVIYGTGKFAESVAKGVLPLGLDLFFCDTPRYYSPRKTMKIEEMAYPVLSEDELRAFQRQFNLLCGMIDFGVTESAGGDSVIANGVPIWIYMHRILWTGILSKIT